MILIFFKIYFYHNNYKTTISNYDLKNILKITVMDYGFTILFTIIVINYNFINIFKPHRVMILTIENYNKCDLKIFVNSLLVNVIFRIFLKP